jgi:hypothetical protein
MINPKMTVSEEEQDWCEHSDIDQDKRCCLDCGKDMTEHLMAQAEYTFEGDR